MPSSRSNLQHNPESSDEWVVTRTSTQHQQSLHFNRISNKTGNLPMKPQRLYKKILVTSKFQFVHRFPLRIARKSVAKVDLLGHDQLRELWPRTATLYLHMHYHSSMDCGHRFESCGVRSCHLCTSWVHILYQSDIIMRRHRAEMSDELLETPMLLKCNAQLGLDFDNRLELFCLLSRCLKLLPWSWGLMSWS